jgi:hypothetical protein
MTISSRSSRGPRADVIQRLREVERVSRAHARRSEHGYFAALADLVAVLAVTLEGSREPADWLFTVATVSRTSAEALLLRRLRSGRSA